MPRFTMARNITTLAQTARGGWRALASNVTAVGWMAIGFAVIGLPLGLALRWIEVSVAGGASVVLLVTALPFLLGSNAFAVEFAVSADRVVAGEPAEGRIRVTNSSRRLQLSGRLDVPVGTTITRLPVPMLRGGAHVESPLEIPTSRRGVIDVGPVRSVRSDPLGLMARVREWPNVRRVYVHPPTVTVPSTMSGFIRDLEGNPTQNLVDSDISFHAIREYVPGDGQRHIHWKSTAKTGRLMVRQFEESRRARMAVLLGTNPLEFATPDEFELAVSVAGSLGTRAIRDGRDVSVLVSGSSRGIRKLSSTAARFLLDDLCTVDLDESASVLHELSTQTSRQLPDLSLVIAVCGSVLGFKQAARMRSTLPSDVAMLLVVCDESAAPGFKEINGTPILTVAVLDDLRALLSRRVE